MSEVKLPEYQSIKVVSAASQNLQLSEAYMTPEQFAYWLQGFVELNDHMPNEAQWQSIKEHLSTVFKKVTPPVQISSIGMALHKLKGLDEHGQNITSLSC